MNVPFSSDPSLGLSSGVRNSIRGLAAVAAAFVTTSTSRFTLKPYDVFESAEPAKCVDVSADDADDAGPAADDSC